MGESKETKVLAAARDVFLRYGYKRVSMKDIGEAAGVSRPALYLLFKNKEEIFIGVSRQWIDETVTEIERGLALLATPSEKLEYAFEVWTVRPFEMALKSPEAKELIECSFDFAQDSLRQGYEKFEAVLVPVLASLAGPPAKQMRPKAVAHVLASAVRGFKQTASTKAELRLLIKQLVALSLGTLLPK
jgi:AcrR family transcriptional regulator